MSLEDFQSFFFKSVENNLV